MAKVRNINGIFNPVCRCGTWLDHWEKFSDISINSCAEVSCQNKTVFGAHVQLANSIDNKWYIVPLCKKHNQGYSIIDIGSTKLVPADKNETCEKRLIRNVSFHKNRFKIL